MKKLNRRKFIKRGILTSIGLVLLDALWFEKYNIEWNYFDISKSKENKVKIIQISDLHFDKLRYFHKSIAKKINAIKPDLIFITGDSVDKTEKINSLNEFLQLIDNSIQKYAITGNWEYWGKVNLTELKKTFLKNNCELLINENRTISIKNREISIIGMDDLVAGNPDFKNATENIKQTQTNIVLAHCPQHRDIISKQKGSLTIDLVLSGHTHGGQITFLGIVPFKPQGSGNYLKGWYDKAEPKMYISKGIGTSILPIRFGARAEMVEIDL
ncbi:metallophosphoesterase [Tenacibaculum finnmarkense]|uniref:metallophosphoesterase n=1 Tax=Tenacibaculum finnmarkense TaxID=2781243 RepID=UPI001E46642F|nr:metallophosphoesterase [Tenacibaculum finnmarkense]MCD8445107.1 metallophosphoesterase [Tenacibaculum finnmarkense genomovar ulcerans]